MLGWFRRHARELPWRGTDNPYLIWVSEIMLQQTQVVTVIPYFERFIAMFPTVKSLAKAREDEVLKLWEGLGYYRRARQMHKAAKVVVEEHGGDFPRDPEHVKALPGIGRYTAGAILSIAFDAREPILEANTIRVISRLLAYPGDTASGDGQRTLWTAAAEFLPRKHVGDFNQAMMELGSEVCKPQQPACERCPVAVLCPTRAHGLQELVPAPKKKTNYEQVREACVVIWKNGKVLLRRCPDGERWAGLWDYPRFGIESSSGRALTKELAEKVTQMTGMAVEPGRHLATIKHGVTRFRIELACYEARWVRGVARGADLDWVKPQQVADYALNVTGRKISQHVFSNEQSVESTSPVK
jgi:A/G-specific adenine glycosylase